MTTLALVRLSHKQTERENWALVGDPGPRGAAGRRAASPPARGDASRALARAPPSGATRIARRRVQRRVSPPRPNDAAPPNRFLAKGLELVATGAPTKAVMLGTVDARVAAKKTKAAKGAEWLDGLTDEELTWRQVNHRCRHQKKRKKKGDKVAGGGKRGSQKGQAAAKKAKVGNYPCAHKCGRVFGHAPAAVAHSKACKMKPEVEE